VQLVLPMMGVWSRGT